jgi:hypothetical protein
MDWNDDEGSSRTEYEVGYKKPPPGTRFSKDRQPERPKKKKPDDRSIKDLLWRLLQEERRVTIDGKVVWRTNAWLVSHRAMQEAEKGSSVLMRLCNELMLGPGGPDEEEPPEIFLGSPASYRD